jgi:hypothetical protein
LPRHAAAALLEVLDDARRYEDAGKKEVRKAAKVLEEAASFYLRAGLGLAAKRCYERSARAFSLVGSSSGIARCVAAAEGVPTFWEED